MVTREQLYVVGAATVVIGIWIASFFHIITFVGTNDNREWLKDKLNTASYTALGGTVAAIIAALAFYVMNPAALMYLLLFMAFMGFGLAWAACAIALIKRK